MPDELVSIQRDGNVAILTLDDGKANVFSPAMANRLKACFEEVGSDFGAVVVTGRPGFFSGGFDLKTIGSGDADAVVDMLSRTVRLTMDLMQFPRPVVGAVSGHCVAMGALFMMAVDYRIGARGNFKIGLNEVRDGLILPIFAVELARYRVPTRHLVASTLHATIYDPDSAVEAGFLEEAVDAEQLMERAMEKARELSALPNPAYETSKRNLAAPTRERILTTLDADLGV